MTHTDFLIIGGGIIGISVARELKKRFRNCRITLIEKEHTLGLHASGRNSGVLHAGFYYSADSLKARFTKIGNQRLTEYCDHKKLKIRKCGKLVVAQNINELKWLDELLARASKNGVVLKSISASEALKIEPQVKTFQRALFSPTTSTVCPTEVTLSLAQDAIDEGIIIRTGVSYLRRSLDGIQTNCGNFKADYLINAAGLYADKIALQYGFSKNYRILPFKGLYLYSDDQYKPLKTHIYPVPDLRNPFLGVHFTITVDGKTKIGPTAIPAFWREQYKGLNNFDFLELMEIAIRQLGLMASSNFDFKQLAFEELMKYSQKNLVSLASKLANINNADHFNQWGQPGIRAQLLDIKERKLEMDFVIEGDERSMHILNAVSPGFTCALPFSEYVCDKIESKLKHDKFS